MTQFFTAVAAMLELLPFEAREFLAHEDTVVVFSYEKARAKLTNQTFEGEWDMVFTLRTGQAVRFKPEHLPGLTATPGANPRRA